MKIALIETHLVDYTGHFYNFITELRKEGLMKLIVIPTKFESFLYFVGHSLAIIFIIFY